MIFRILKFIFNLLPSFNKHRSIKNFLYNQYIIRKEVSNLSNIKKKKILIVYDLSCSPPTLGDYFCTVMVARFFLLIGKEVIFYIVNDKLRTENWKRLKKVSQIKKIIEMKKIAKQVLFVSGKKYHIHLGSFESLKKKYFIDQTYQFFFKEKILQRKKIYNFSTNFLFFYSRKQNQKFINKFLLNKNSFS